jgi:hypothetical protein
MKRSRICLLLAAAYSLSALADQGARVLPPRHVDLGDVAYNSINVPTAGFKVTLTAHCVGANLRDVQNALVPGQNITMTVHMQQNTPTSPQVGSATVTFDGLVPTSGAPNGTAPVTLVTFPGTSVAQWIGNTVTFSIAIPIDPNPANNYIVAPNGVTFTQAPPGAPAGTGISPLSPLTFTNTPSDGSGLNIDSSFVYYMPPNPDGSPKHGGLCGSYWSPLMVFFNDDRPQITSVSSFPLRPEGEKFYWPEGSKNWAFLVYDKAGNGKIEKADQLFGSEDADNGFESLKKLDSNHDGKIDKKDKEFAKIKLWYDLNGNGVVDPGELQPLSQAKIDMISLKYQSDKIVPVGERAQFREYGQAFSGKKSFEVIDVWFGVHTFKSIVPAKKEAPDGTKKKT